MTQFKKPAKLVTQKQEAKKKVPPEEYGKAPDFKDFSLRYRVLQLMGEEAKVRYNRNLLYGAGEYNLKKLQGTLKFIPDLQNFKNIYYLEGKTDEITKIANYFEYGTGLFNTRTRPRYIRPINYQYMRWQDKDTGQMIFVKKTKGVKPVFAMTKAVKSIELDKEILLPKLIKKAVISR